MSAIGDYIHLTSYGYIKSGTFQMNDTKSNFSEVPQIFYFQRKKISQKAFQTTLTTQAKKEIEQSLNLLMGKGSLGDQAQDKALNEIWQILKKVLSEQFTTLVPEAISRETANIMKQSSSLGITKYYFSTINKGTDKETKNKIELNSMLSRVQKLQDFVTKIQNQNKHGGNQIAQLEESLKEIYFNLNQMLKIKTETLKKTGYTELIDKSNIKTITLANNKYSYEEAHTVVESINKMIAKVNGTTNLQKGTLFQYLIAVAPLVGTRLAGKELEKAVREALAQSVKGNIRSSVKLDQRNFYGNLDQILNQRGNYYTRYVNQNIFVANKPSQDKVDVTINWKNSKVNISAKNINLDSNSFIKNGIGGASPYITLLSDGNILALLQSMDSNFVNHYLNIIAKHRGVEEFDNRLMEPAHESMKLNMLVCALEGYKQDASKANVFFINDNTTGRVKIFEMGEIIKRILTWGSLQNDSIIVNAGKNRLEKLRLTNNNFKYDKRDRITNILNLLHTYKITVALKKNLITELYH